MSGLMNSANNLKPYS